MSRLAEDLRFALRTMRKTPAFTAIVLLTLTLGTGATTAIFSAVNAVLIRDLPYPDPGRLVLLWGVIQRRDMHRSQISYPDLEAWRKHSRLFEDMSAYTGYWFPTYVGGNGAIQLAGARVSDGFFRVMKARTILGRTFTPHEQFDGRGPVAVISYGLWQSQFGKDPAIVGSKRRLDSQLFTIVGVLAPDVASLPVTLVDHPVEIYRPLSKSFSDEIDNGRHLRGIGRLKPGVSLGQAQAELTVIARQLETDRPDTNQGLGVRVVSLHDDIAGPIRPGLLILQVCVVLVLLIACGNVANLLLARSATRRKEIAIRAALGAARARLIRQMLTESVLLALAGGVAGLLLALWSVPLLETLGAKVLPEVSRVSVDWRVAGFALALSVACGIAFGLAPALGLSSGSLSEDLKIGGRSPVSSSGGMRGFLVVAEIAFALMLVICAGLLVNSFLHLRNVNPGFDGRNTLVFDLALPASRYPRGDLRQVFVRRMLDSLTALPGATSVAVVSVLPESSNFNQMSLDIQGRSYSRLDKPAPDDYEVTPDYFRTFSIPLIRGRLFTAQDDREHAQVAIVNETAARRLWPGENPLGRKVHVGGPEEPWRSIVGVVGDVYQYGLDSRKTLQIYQPYFQNRVPELTVLVHSAGDPLPLLAPARRAVAVIDPEMALSNISTMEQTLADSIAGRRFPMLLLAAFGLCALSLAAIGAYGVLSYSVAQRTAEFGVRMALGARPRDVLGLVLRKGLLLAVAGIAIGCLGALLASRLLARLLFGVTATDPATYASAAALLLIAAVFACLLPAWRATRVDPLAALRSE